ncbi:MAG: polyhydroxyalkanoate synthesis repressor PhaR [Phenylobacterium sp.]|uniref:polyhydroxyalkanoate synthesis repressor PhaR n=1 Tax=Phenylobacterium sp. TaxID=1871053 RepID=UPI0025D17DE4|nr:polyhydroxyalkanoate synthesis repressor PhaR [Phenylobacterium sp.]MCA6224471.1 polyhydroxyalkanoate synthesis repressor PhaR [Phenylobacterium sp.]MCA6225984.1 polyhydroxyalkanoate synthesis repressor PhaR [Phenylobacterium sp.]MCA6230968.1 polyhydroxyalkanoate synthesis repressor PhaR [Phenylobacterium sp.]MCA6233821.1 polyhydroxyalkanoate synthesis repressor PhaR [Phenylobacterium sp.]MCA6248128.1 polyhydroxyalkanoate synthesis repressor PhaR [Phenylobacterium sp.]
MAETKGAKAGDGPVVIKKYANRRLYNTASSTYVTLEHLADMVRKGVDFVVYDAKTNDDITRSVLAQIIFDEESRSESLLPIQFLRQLIGFYGNSMQALLPSYLEMSLASFADQQERLRQQFSGMNPPAGLAAYEDQVKKNMALFSQAMQMFSPFAYGRPEAGQAEPGVPGAGAPVPAAAPAEKASDEAIADLKRRMEEMAAQIDRLASGR